MEALELVVPRPLPFHGPCHSTTLAVRRPPRFVIPRSEGDEESALSRESPKLQIPRFTRDEQGYETRTKKMMRQDDRNKTGPKGIGDYTPSFFTSSL
jgi:hypothetical protein